MLMTQPAQPATGGGDAPAQQPDEITSEVPDDTADGSEKGTDESDSEIIEPVEVGDDETEEPPAATAVGIPWGAVIIFTAIILAAYAWLMSQAWQYVIKTGEDAEKGDWDQLNSIIDKVDYLVLFVLGAVFGITAQSRQTSAARNAAKKNQKTARQHRETAAKNKHAAKRNKTTAIKQGKLVLEAATGVDHARKRVQDIQRNPNVSFATTPVVQRGRLVRENQGVFNLLQDTIPEHVVLEADHVTPTSPDLDDVTDDLDALAERLRAKAL